MDTDDSPPSRTGEQVLPATMRAVRAPTPGGPDALLVEQTPVPVPGPDHVLVRVAAAGVNRPDVLQRKGGYPPPPGVTDIPGLEVSGTIVAIGSGVDRVKLGQPVCALVPGGGYAEYCVAPAGCCLPVPDGLSMVEAAALPETLFTVWSNVFERGFAADGDWILVHGGTSGIGTTAIALGRLFGLKVIVTAGSDEKCAAAVALGARAAINYRTTEFESEVLRLTEGRGVAVVLDMVGGDYVPRNLKCLAVEGRHVSIAVQGGAQATIPLFDIMRRRLILTGSTLRPRSVAFKSALADEIARMVWPAVSSGHLRPVLDMTFPLGAAAAAHERMEQGTHVGKIVLTLDG